jgi:CelD/BcsL family acetyltransferase involved in cellulose biosynthesis
MRVDEITTGADLAKLEHPWQKLWEKCSKATPFQSPAWLIPWWNEFHPGELITLVFSQEEQLVAVVPMFLFDGTIRLLGAGNTDYLDILCVPDAIGPVLCLLASYLSDCRIMWSVCDFTDLPDFSPLLRADTSAIFSVPVSECSICPVLKLDKPKVSKKLLANLADARHRLEKKGGFSYEEASGISTVEMIDALIRLHESRWATKNDGGVLRSEDICQFHRKAALALSRAGLLRLYGLCFQGQLIAVHYCLFGHGRTYYYLGGFDPGMAAYSPGNLLTYYSIAKAISCDHGEYDFLRGREAYKYRWGAEDRSTFRILRSR